MSFELWAASCEQTDRMVIARSSRPKARS